MSNCREDTMLSVSFLFFLFVNQNEWDYPINLRESPKDQPSNILNKRIY